ncbi:MAG: BON domain-containing protein [Bdellovibrionaceae bacterium]|nr:BON domain-containing protein [Pseudobdellovibrionaceae bacterium]
MKTDSQIQTDVMQELKWDPSVTHEHIGVAVSDGVVTLAGSVPSYVEKLAAEKAAQRVFGVQAVVEKIEVKLPGTYKRDDQDIAKTILSHFMWNIQVPEDLVKASVENGWVTLSGEVEWDYQRTAAEKCVRSLTGVKGVNNCITLKAKKVQPEIVKERIEEALKRKAEREARRISVVVNGGRVILSGNVGTFSEMQDVRGAAWSAPGVVSVENNLHIVGT